VYCVQIIGAFLNFQNMVERADKKTPCCLHAPHCTSPRVDLIKLKLFHFQG